MLAVIAVATVFLSVFLTEIMQQQFTPAYGRFCVCGSVKKELPTYFLLVDRLHLHEFLQLLQVLVRVIRDTNSLTSVASRTSCFLIIAFKALWNIIMYDKPHIRFVDAHTECDCGYNDIDTFHQEIILCLRAHFRVKTSMIGCNFYVVCRKMSGQLLHFLS